MGLLHVVVCKAEPLAGQPVPDAVIEIVMSIPTGMSLESAEQFHHDQAKRIVDALFASLPQGTADRLWIYAMQRKLSLYQGTTTG